MPEPFASLLITAFLGLLGLVLLLNIFGLPGNWVLLGLVGLWKYLYPSTGELGVGFFALMIGLAVLGELLELGLQVLNARKFGSSSSGNLAGMIGAVAGAILLAPLFFGLGALIGALVGAWLGCFMMEILKGRPGGEASSAAFGAMMGRFLGTIFKCGVGGGMLALTGRYIRAEDAPSLPLPIPAPPTPPQDQMVQLLHWLC